MATQDEILSDYLSNTDTEHEIGSIFEIGADFQDEYGDDVAEIGAMFSPRLNLNSKGFYKPTKIRIPARIARRLRKASNMSKLPGFPTSNNRQVPLGFPQAQLVNGAASPATVSATVEVEPQTIFQPIRMVAEAYDAGSGAEARGVTVTSIRIGGSEMLTAGGEGVSLALFKSDYQGANAAVLDRIAPGMKARITFSALVPATTTYNVETSWVGARQG